jgi:hypothetical protein
MDLPPDLRKKVDVRLNQTDRFHDIRVAHLIHFPHQILVASRLEVDSDLSARLLHVDVRRAVLSRWISDVKLKAVFLEGFGHAGTLTQRMGLVKSNSAETMGEALCFPIQRGAFHLREARSA